MQSLLFISSNTSQLHVWILCAEWEKKHWKFRKKKLLNFALENWQPYRKIYTASFLMKKKIPNITKNLGHFIQRIKIQMHRERENCEIEYLRGVEIWFLLKEKSYREEASERIFSLIIFKKKKKFINLTVIRMPSMQIIAYKKYTKAFKQAT